MPTGTILAYSVPDGAEVFVDGNSIPSKFGGIARTPTIIPDVSADRHNITFRLSGYKEETIPVDITQGGYSTVTAILSRKV